MTTKRTPKRPAAALSKPDDGWKGFVNIELSASAKETVISESKTPESLERALDALITNGYKVSFSYDERSGCIQATATGTAKSVYSSGYATSARSEDYTRAAVALSIKVLDIADNDLSVYATAKVSSAEV